MLKQTVNVKKNLLRELRQKFKKPGYGKSGPVVVMYPSRLGMLPYREEFAKLKEEGLL